MFRLGLATEGLCFEIQQSVVPVGGSRLKTLMVQCGKLLRDSVNWLEPSVITLPPALRQYCAAVRSLAPETCQTLLPLSQKSGAVFFYEQLRKNSIFVPLNTPGTGCLDTREERLTNILFNRGLIVLAPLVYDGGAGGESRGLRLLRRGRCVGPSLFLNSTLGYSSLTPPALMRELSEMGPLQATRVEVEGGLLLLLLLLPGSDYKADHTLLFLLRATLSVPLRDFYRS